MDLEEIFKIIQQEIIKISNEYKKDPRYKICKEYVDDKNNHISSVEDLLKIDIWNFIRCLIYINKNENTTLSDCENIAGNIKTFFEKLDLEKTESFIDDIWSAATETVETYEEITNFKKGEMWKQISEIIKFTRENEEIAMIIFDFLETRKEIELTKEVISSFIASLQNVKVRQKTVSKAKANFYKRDYDVSYIFKIHKSINDFIQDEDKKEKKHKTAVCKKIRDYQKAIFLLERAEKQQEITNAREIIKNISNEEIVIKILIWINNHNQKYYKELIQKEMKTKEDSNNNYLAVLSKHNLVKYVKYVATIKHNKPEEVDEIISILKKSEYDEEEIMLILQRTTKRKFDIICEYVKAGYITSDKIKGNQTIYYQEDNKLATLQNTIRKIEKIGINPKFFKSSSEYLWQETDTFLKNLSLLKDYNMINMIKRCKKIDFLLEDHLEEKIDLFIELGFLEYLKENLELLNYSISRLKRLELLRQMNYPIEDIDTLEEILKNVDFIVKDEELDNYIMDYASYKKQDTHILEGLDIETDEISICIENSFFSIPKIKRKLAENNTLLEAMFYNKRVTADEYNQIINKIINKKDYKFFHK